MGLLSEEITKLLCLSNGWHQGSRSRKDLNTSIGCFKLPPDASSTRASRKRCHAEARASLNPVQLLPGVPAKASAGTSRPFITVITSRIAPRQRYAQRAQKGVFGKGGKIVVVWATRLRTSVALHRHRLKRWCSSMPPQLKCSCRAAYTAAHIIAQPTACGNNVRQRLTGFSNVLPYPAKFHDDSTSFP